MGNITPENPEVIEEGIELADDAVPVCPDCFSECNPQNFYCLNCGSNEAINPLASYMPYVKIRFETGLFGKLWRKCWHPQTQMFCRVFFVFFLALFYLPFFILGLPFLCVEKIHDQDVKRFYSGFCYVFALIVLLFFGMLRFVLITRMIR